MTESKTLICSDKAKMKIEEEEEEEEIVCLDESFFINYDYQLTTFTFGSHVLQLFCLQSASTDFDLTGQLVWPGAMLLNDYLSKNADMLRGCSIIELGSGVGITGILCSRFCRQVVLTDHNEEVLKILDKNIELHSSSENSNCELVAEKLEWGNVDQINQISQNYSGGFDLVLGADICFQQSSIPLLFGTIEQFLSIKGQGRCKFILAYVSRTKVGRGMMARSEQDKMGSWTDLLHSSTKLLEQAAPSAQFPPLQRNLDQLEALSKKLKAKTLRTEAPSQSNAATRLLACEGINAEQLARDLKSFELKTTFEDVFPAEATSVEEYMQQVHEMALVLSIQEAQKDNLRSFNDYMMEVLEDDWQKEKRDFLQSLSRISTLPKINMIDTGSGDARLGPMVSVAPSPHVSSGPSGLEVLPLGNKPIIETKALVYAEVVKNLNNARERGLPFKPATAFKGVCEGLDREASGGKSVDMQKIWHLILTMMGEEPIMQQNVSRKMSLVIGARRHLETGHEKYIMDTIQSHPAQAALGGAVGNLQRVHAFLRIRLRDYGVLDFDTGDSRRQPPIDTTWQQIYFCLRTGYYDEARNVAISSRASHHFAPLLTEWINTGGMVRADIAAAASEECEKLLRMGDRIGRAAYDKKKLLLYAIISGSRRQIDRLLRDLPALFNTIEDFLWFKLSAVREYPSGASSVVLNEGFAPYSLDDLQVYLNKFEPSYYTKNGKDPLVYPYVLLLSIQLLPAVLYLSKEAGDEGYKIDAAHITIVLADHGFLSEGVGAGQKLGVMDAYAEASSLIRQYGSFYLRLGNLAMALEYYAQAAAAIGGGHFSWSGRGNVDQQRQRSLMLKQLLTELLLRDGGIYLLLGSRGAGEEGELRRFLPDFKARQQFLLEAARQCQESGLYDESIEIQKRIGAISMALDTINKCLSEAICALSRGRPDGESRIAGLIHSGNEILETFKYYPEVSPQEREHSLEQETVLRQLEAILSIHKLARLGNHVEALREIAKLPFLPFDPRTPDTTLGAFQNMSPHVQACVPDLLKVALSCLDSVADTDGSLRAMRTKIANFLANNTNLNWPRDLYDKVARNL